MNEIRSSKGITLVALVITIIILLALASISISSLVGLGLFKKAQLAKMKQDNAQIEENIKLSDYENKVEEYLNGSRQNGNVPTGSTVIYNSEDDPNGILCIAGQTDGTSERTFSEYNVNDFDTIIIVAGYTHESTNTMSQSLYIDKNNFDENMIGLLSFSSIYNQTSYRIKIDSANNKMNLLYSGGGDAIGIKKVIGVKY